VSSKAGATECELTTRIEMLSWELGQCLLWGGFLKVIQMVLLLEFTTSKWCCN